MASTPESGSTCGDSLDSGTSAHHCTQPDDEEALEAQIQVLTDIKTATATTTTVMPTSPTTTAIIINPTTTTTTTTIKSIELSTTNCKNDRKSSASEDERSGNQIISTNLNDDHHDDIHKKQQQQQHQQQQSQQQLEQEQEHAIFPPLDEVPEPIKVLDDIISEFEDLTHTAKPALQTIANGENHSEDDGYMSLSRKNLPSKDGASVTLSQNSVEEVNTTTTPPPPLPPSTPSPASSPSPLPPQAPATLPTLATDTASSEATSAKREAVAAAEATTMTTTTTVTVAPVQVATTEAEIVQSTLPKVRPTMAATVGSKNYSSLPCCGGGRSQHANGSTANGRASNAHSYWRTRHGSCNGEERNVLGIDISAVHNAVLRGGLAKLPEPIVNEHPVTIYPGPSSKSRSQQRSGSNNATSQPTTAKATVDKHKLQPLASVTSTSTSPSSASTSTSSSASSSSSGERATRDSEHSKETRTGVTSSRRPHAVAWEIHFDVKGKSQHNKSYTTSKLPIKTQTQQPPPTSCYMPAPAMAMALGVSDQVDAPELQHNYCMYRNSDMLGKGTFIIRRNNAKKPVLPYASDIFKSPPSSSCDEPALEHQQADYQHASGGHELQPLPVAMTARQISPARDKLLLHIEPLQPAHEYGLLAHANSMTCFDGGEDVAVASSGELSCDSLNDEHSTSLEEEELEDETEESSDNMQKALDLSSYDDYHGYQVSANVAAAINGASSRALKAPPLMQMPPPLQQQQEYVEMRTSNTTTPHTDLAPTLEEDEEQYSDFSYGGGNVGGGSGGAGRAGVAGAGGGVSVPAPLKQIESNISALLRGDIAVARVGELPLPQPASSQQLQAQQQPPLPMAMPMPMPPLSHKRALDFRPSIVHKSESAKEMLLSQNAFGPLPPSPPSSPDAFDYETHMPPLPPSPTNLLAAAMGSAPLVVEITTSHSHSNSNSNTNTKSSNITTTSAEVHSHHSHSHSNHTSHQSKQLQPLPPVPTLPLPLPPLPRTEERRSRDRHARHNNNNNNNDELPLHHTFDLPPAVPPHHRSSHSMNTLKSRSIDSNYKRRKSPKVLSGYGTGNCNGTGLTGTANTTPTGPPPLPPSYDGPGGGFGGGGGGVGAGVGGGGAYSTKRYISYGSKQRSLKQSPREEQRLQTSCSLPETPIFARGSCDIPRTPFRRQHESGNAVNGSRTAPRSSTAHNIHMGNSIVGIAAGAGTYSASMCRQRSINHALASNEMLRLSGAPARGWYPKQRTMRPASTENIDRLATARVWDSAAGMSGTGQRKPLTLPPNLTPSFLNKSPREALRRVTSLLITKKKNTKERRNKPYGDHAAGATAATAGDASYHNYDEVNTINTKHDTARSAKHGAGSSNTSGQQKAGKEKKRGIFKNLWKRTKHVSIEQ